MGEFPKPAESAIFLIFLRPACIGVRPIIGGAETAFGFELAVVLSTGSNADRS
jgi:hypothetical protein